MGAAEVIPPAVTRGVTSTGRLCSQHSVWNHLALRLQHRLPGTHAPHFSPFPELQNAAHTLDCLGSSLVPLSI